MRRVTTDTTTEHQHWHIVEKRFGDARHRVRQPGPRHQISAGQPPRSAPDAVGHEGCRLLIGNQDRPYARTFCECGVQLDVMCAGDSEREGNARVFQRAYDSVTTTALRQSGLLCGI